MTRRSLRLVRPLLPLLLACSVAGAPAAQEFPRYGDALYEPKLRQPGKDVMWLPTPDAVVTRMLQAAKTTDRDLVYDLGAGEGRIPIAAAKQFGATAVGIEYDAALAALAKRNAERANVAAKVTIIQGDVFKEDFSKATVVTLYLLPELNHQLRPRILKMKPGTRVVSHMWDMGEWEADDAFAVGDSDVYLWVVPASVAGRWRVRDNRGWEGELNLTQQFQRIGGTLTLRGKVQPLLGAYVNGTTLGFTFVDTDTTIRSARLTVDGNALTGQLRFASYTIPVEGQRVIGSPRRRRRRPPPRGHPPWGGPAAGSTA